jgi:hypothetical protein
MRIDNLHKGDRTVEILYLVKCYSPCQISIESDQYSLKDH